MTSALKNKKLLIIGGDSFSVDIVKTAQSMGIYTIVTDWYDTKRSPAKLVADEYWNTSIEDYESLTKQIQEHHVDGILTGFTDSYLLAAQSNPELQAIFDFMQNNPQISVEIIGHTDDIGSEQYNLELSQNRAEEVKRFLCKKGISDNRIKCVGKGESEPLASNDTEEGRALNRRTELKITK